MNGYFPRGGQESQTETWIPIPDHTQTISFPETQDFKLKVEVTDQRNVTVTSPEFYVYISQKISFIFFIHFPHP